jgi:hypothetical protein
MSQAFLISAADLKFLQRLPQSRPGTSNRKRHYNHKVANARSFPKFVSEDAAMYHELRKPGTSRGSVACLTDFVYTRVARTCETETTR